MSNLKVKSLIGREEITILDLHSDPLDGAEYYQKIMPSSIRKKITEKANQDNQSELITICNLLIKHFSIKRIKA